MIDVIAYNTHCYIRHLFVDQKLSSDETMVKIRIIGQTQFSKFTNSYSKHHENRRKHRSCLSNSSHKWCFSN